MEYCPQPERNHAAWNITRNPSTNVRWSIATQAINCLPAVIFKFTNYKLSIPTLKALHTGFKRSSNQLRHFVTSLRNEKVHEFDGKLRKFVISTEN
jgi:hypothetical protein